MIHIAKEVDIQLLKITSASFQNNGLIPKKYTCDGLNQSPSFNIDNIPKDTKTLAIIVEDPDAPINTWIHWLVWNLPVSHTIKENTHLGCNGVNDFSRRFYCGPCPFSGLHHYIFKFYAINTILDISINSKKIDLERAMSDHILAFGQITGLYKRF